MEDFKREYKNFDYDEDIKILVDSFLAKFNGEEMSLWFVTAKDISDLK